MNNSVKLFLPKSFTDGRAAWAPLLAGTMRMLPHTYAYAASSHLSCRRTPVPYLMQRTRTAKPRKKRNRVKIALCAHVHVARSLSVVMIGFRMGHVHVHVHVCAQCYLYSISLLYGCVESELREHRQHYHSQEFECVELGSFLIFLDLLFVDNSPSSFR